jgi:hypothetical protein
LNLRKLVSCKTKKGGEGWRYHEFEQLKVRAEGLTYGCDRNASIGSSHANEDSHQRQGKDKDNEPELSDGYVELAHIYSDRFGSLHSLFRSWRESLLFWSFFQVRALNYKPHWTPKDVGLSRVIVAWALCCIEFVNLIGQQKPLAGRAKQTGRPTGFFVLDVGFRKGKSGVTPRTRADVRPSEVRRRTYVSLQAPSTVLYQQHP